MEILIVFGTGVVCGLYLATQIEKNIFKNITSKKKTRKCRCGRITNDEHPMCDLCKN